MEDKTPPSANAPEQAVQTAKSLRELHERARSAIAAQRQRMSHLEAQLTERLDTIADSLVEQTSTAADSALAAASTAEAEQLRQQLADAQAVWDAEREQMLADAAIRQQKLDQRQAELEIDTGQLATFRGELDARQATLDERATQLNSQERELSARQVELSRRDQQDATASGSLAEVERQLAESREELAAKEQRWDSERSALVAEREALAEQVAEITAVGQSSESELDSQRSELQQQLDELRAAADSQRQLLEQARDDLATELAQTREELETARGQADAAADGSELQQKFDLALEDLQRLRQRVAELEQELDTRPAADQSESVELVHLRAERDALAERIAELEQQATLPADGDATEEMSDLQRRFELAVEDVRDLKRQNAELEEQLADSKSRGGAGTAPALGGGSNWELMKRQMLASLEGEVDDGDEKRQQERAKIEGTIRITDEVVARKDKEIAELQSRLAKSGGEKLAEDAAVRELVDADMVIQQHRAETAKLETEMREKLRAAELELSVERAKIAREQVQLADLRADIDAMRPAAGSGNASSSAPKRRWLSKLGISSEDEGR